MRDARVDRLRGSHPLRPRRKRDQSCVVVVVVVVVVAGLLFPGERNPAQCSAASSWACSTPSRTTGGELRRGPVARRWSPFSSSSVWVSASSTSRWRPTFSSCGWTTAPPSLTYVTTAGRLFPPGVGPTPGVEKNVHSSRTAEARESTESVRPLKHQASARCSARPNPRSRMEANRR